MTNFEIIQLMREMNFREFVMSEMHGVTKATMDIRPGDDGIKFVIARPDGRTTIEVAL